MENPIEFPTTFHTSPSALPTALRLRRLRGLEDEIMAMTKAEDKASASEDDENQSITNPFFPK